MEVKITNRSNQFNIVAAKIETCLFLVLLIVLLAMGMISTLLDKRVPPTETTTITVETTEEEPKAETTKFMTTTAETTEAETKFTTTFRVTAYCACYECCEKTDGITASGTVATQGRTIAVDPDYYPYGTEIILNGNTYIAEDCGDAIQGNDIDLFFDSHQDALDWGVQYLEGVVVW